MDIGTILILILCVILAAVEYARRKITAGYRHNDGERMEG